MSIITSRSTIIRPVRNISELGDYDPVYILDQDERLRRRKNSILESLDIAKLENSRTREGKINTNGYSTRQMTNILISIGVNTTGQKSSYIDTLIDMRKQYEADKNKLSKRQN